MTDTTTMETDLDKVIADFSMETIYVPTEIKIKDDLKDVMLRYKVTLSYKGRPLLTTDYSMGIGHIPGYSHWGRSGYTLDEWALLQHILKTGTGRWFENKRYTSVSGIILACKDPILPTLKDVLYCLISDSDVMNYRGFEDWADNLGYDTDSRKAEATWKACMDIALKLRNGIGQTKFDELVMAYQDY